jgi:hypothetical protein
MRSVRLWSLALIVSGMMMSCSSPDQPLVNAPPVVTLSARQLAVLLGDTLWVTIHASDETLSDVRVDFGDGNALALQTPKPVLDTTLSHRFGKSGAYTVVVTASDGRNETTKRVRASVWNTSPTVTLQPDKTVLEFGDTLRLVLHASDTSLSSGSVDFADGTILEFTHLDHRIDTTILHAYAHSGTYRITSTFHDGFDSTMSGVSITVSNTPPEVTLRVNKSTLNVGDSLIVTLHASDRTLSSGSVDFKDGTVVQFTHVHVAFDTVVTHIYTRPGTYDVTASFGDGDTVTTSLASVDLVHLFALSFPVGAVWKFAYSYYVAQFSHAFWIYLNGTHEWTILSSSVSGADTVFTVQQVRADSERFIGAGGGSHGDTTFFVHDTSQFTFSVSYNSMQFTWPLEEQLQLHTDVVPNHVVVSALPLRLETELRGGFYNEVVGSRYALYDDTVGPLRYGYTYNDNRTVARVEDFTLIGFVKP